jgi:hypothetical protein
LKICTVCKENKELTEFYKWSLSKDGYQHRCKKCDDKAVKAYRKKHRERFLTNMRKANLKHKYGITIEDYEHMLKEQNYRCKLCTKHQEDNDCWPTSDTTMRLAVDHVHDTGKIRGLLCNRCNRALGLFNEDAELLKRASEYVAEIH